MSPYTHPKMRSNRDVYDLRAVCSHYGFMNFGHYIAFCKPYTEKEISDVNMTNTDGKFLHLFLIFISYANFSMIHCFSV